MNVPRFYDRPESVIRHEIEQDPTGAMLGRLKKSGIDLIRHAEYAEWLPQMAEAEGEVTSVRVFHDLISHCIAIGRGNPDRDMLADIAFEYADDAGIAYEEIRDARHDLFTGGIE